MSPYQPVSPEVYLALEDIYLLKDRCNITFLDNDQKKTLINTQLTDLYTEEDGQYVILEGITRIRLDNILAINGKPVQYFT